MVHFIVATHLSKYGNLGKQNIFYKLYQTYKQFICIKVEKIEKTIIQEIKITRYYPININSIPHIGHIDQLSFIVWYFNEDSQP